MRQRCALADGGPLVTTKKPHLRSIIHGLQWFLSGDTDIGHHQANGVSVRDQWADENGDPGRVYGADRHAFAAPLPSGPCDAEGPLCRARTADQIADLVEAIRTGPDSRRLIVSA